MHKDKADETVYPGRTIAPGIGSGVAWVESLLQSIDFRRITTEQLEEERTRFRKALDVVRKTVKQHIKDVHGDVDDDFDQILKAHEMMLYDKEIIQRIEARIRNEKLNAEWAVNSELDGVINRFESTPDPYFHARAEDIRDLKTNILNVLLKRGETDHQNLDGDASIIMVTKNLYPSLAMKAYRNRAAGFVTESKAVFSHAAIMLKGFGIPVIGAVEHLFNNVEDGDQILLDGLNGRVFVHPKEATKGKYRRLKQKVEKPIRLDDYRPEPARTYDGFVINLMANVEHLNQVPLVFLNKLKGIGLFRTEFFAIWNDAVPGEEEQISIYRNLIKAMGKYPVTIRTLDIGADKRTSRLHRCAGMNPALGLRGIRRHIFHEREEFRIQLRAILQAATDGPTRIMFPMVTTVGDIRAAKEHVHAVMETLERENVPYSKDIKLGAMIEIPAAAIRVGDILKEVDFISIGTNDLLQYVTGADRNNQEVLSYYDPYNEAFTWLLGYIIEQAQAAGREEDVYICGELAGNIEFIPTLLTLGYRNLSIAPVGVNRIRSSIAAVMVTHGTEGRS